MGLIGQLTQVDVKMKIVVLAITVCLVGLTHGHTGFGQCPDFTGIANFEPEKYLGQWYEYARFSMVWELFGDCSAAMYTDQSEDGKFILGVNNTGINSLTGGPMNAVGQ